ncbi:potassium transporter [Natrinema sp. CBA1119]|uniref:potassium channel family protein n=1 Tax=Natrinema sp. CBA1119 TaxID=1608465 RepID=UPI000BF69CB4|nr:NAD-binding protein [Natrinema sp. CBA1119]PGF14056.1 potassium transporter [Natrinema sp. CBA1119]
MSLLKSRRTGYYLLLVAVTTVFFTLLYNHGMGAWEDRPQPLYRSLEIVFQTYTTTGYGEDAPWQTPQMNLLMIGMQLAGIGLILTAADVFAVPWLRNALSPSAPTTTDAVDHVVICEYTPRGEEFVAELNSRGQEYVIVESDVERATALHEADNRVVHGDPESIKTLENAGVDRARAVVADAADDVNASIVLSAKEVNPDVRTVTLAEDVALEEYHRIAGADSVLSPRQLLGESLARQVPTVVTTVVDDGIELGNDLELVELSIETGSELCNRTVDEARLRERFGVDIVGVWVDGDFKSPIVPEIELNEDIRLLVAGEPKRITALREEATSSIQSLSVQRVLVAGYGEAGSTAADVLAETNTEVTVIDSEEKAGVDIVGDAREPAVFREAGIDDASAVIVTLNDDTTAIFTTLIASDLNPDVDVIVRANEPESKGKLYRAGAAYVQSLATVSGRMLASTIYEDESVLAVGRQIDVVELPVGRLAGRTLVDADVRSETGATVLVVVRDGETIADFDPDTFTFEPDDEVVLAGTDESVRRFETEFLSGV